MSTIDARAIVGRLGPDGETLYLPSSNQRSDNTPGMFANSSCGCCASCGHARARDPIDNAELDGQYRPCAACGSPVQTSST